MNCLLLREQFFQMLVPDGVRRVGSHTGEEAIGRRCGRQFIFTDFSVCVFEVIG